MGHQNRTVVIDTETTGLIAKSNRIIEIACVEIIDGALTGSVFTSLINPKGHQITQEAFRTHGIYDHELIDQPTFKTLASEIIAFCAGAKLVTYNALFDGEFLKHEFARNGINHTSDLDLNRIECLMTLVTSKLARKRHLKLEDACKLWDFETNNDGRHRALNDALDAAKLYLAVKSREPVKIKLTKPVQKKRQSFIPRSAEHPLTGDRIQLNCCRNVACANYGVVPKAKTSISTKQRRQFENGYSITGRLIEPSLKCTICGNSYSLVNNSSYAELLGDINGSFKPRTYCCPNTRCSNHGHDIENFPKHYRLTGNSKVKDKHHQHENWYRETFVDGRPAYKPKPMEHYHNAGEIPSQRVTCKSCDSRFTIPMTPEIRHYRKDSHHNFFKALMSGVSNMALGDTLNIQTKTVYDKINFIHQQCLAFEHDHIGDVLDAISVRQLALSTDRQHYSTSWNDRDRIEGHTSLRAIATVDNITGFILGSHLNFDNREDAFSIRQKSSHIQDTVKARAYRRFGQYALSDSYIKTEEAKSHKAFERQRRDQQRGLLIHESYQMLAHFDFIKPFVTKAKTVLWSLDNDSGLASALVSVYPKEVVTSNMCALLLSSKDREMSAIEYRQIEKAIQQHPPFETPHDGLANLWSAKMLPEVVINKGNRQHQWRLLPSKSYKRITAMAEVSSGDVPLETLGPLFRYLGLWGVDHCFRLARESVHKFRRPVTTAKRGNKSFAYAGFDPAWQSKLTDIFRVYYNYCIEGKHGTPAYQLGVRAGTVDIDEILNFSKIRDVIQKRKRKKWTPYDSEIELPDNGEFRFKKR